MLLLTDGIHEAASETGERFGLERLINVIRAHRQAEPANLIEMIYTTVCRFCGAAPQKDDITLLCLRATDLTPPTHSPASVHNHAPRQAP